MSAMGMATTPKSVARILGVLPIRRRPKRRVRLGEDGVALEAADVAEQVEVDRRRLTRTLIVSGSAPAPIDSR